MRLSSNQITVQAPLPATSEVGNCGHIFMNSIKTVSLMDHNDEIFMILKLILLGKEPQVMNATLRIVTFSRAGRNTRGAKPEERS